MIRIYVTILLACLPALTGLYAQQQHFQNLYFVKKNKAATFDENDFQPGKNAFYIYRNCIYNITLQNKKELRIKVIDIQNDSIYYTTYFNQNVAAKFRDRFDTFRLHPAEIRKIQLIADRILGIFAGHSLKKSNYVFVKATEPKAFKHIFDTVFSTDCNRQTVYELVPYVTNQGLDVLYEQSGNTYYYEGNIANTSYADSLKKKKPFQLRKWVWFTPSNANEIRGVNVGIQTWQNNDDSLAIKGVNINADALSFYAGIFSLLLIYRDNNLINIPDTADKSNMPIQVKGVSLSGGGLIGDIQTKGVSINGGICGVEEASGLVITGSQNLIAEFKGVVIGGLRNKSSIGRGVQIGLLNICKHMKGIQLGLWNVNSKRKLPLINWSF